ncbi:FUSC family protein [Kaistella sp. G5-32]|uniref:FUSC family protein n=1 Tax=Kaistella gelatinilytica TaxID=2787636 RepID=A0ABS0FE51_9FLAO|nr:FUSC family protein [Kaistella gelatinilytica]MBF8457979.1 FUSC family protein [Kaistella gelatinilytica]
MKQKEPSEMTAEELLIELQKIKSTNVINALLVGVMIGVAIYSTVRNGFGILTAFPLFFIPMFAKKWSYKKALEKESKERDCSRD